MAWRILFFAVLGYLLILTALYIFQRKLLYLPGTSRVSSSRIGQEGMYHWPSEVGYRGVASLQPLEAKGTVLVFHGNAGTAYQRGFYVKAIAPLGLRVILVEYPGYGGRHGRPSEDVLVNDGLRTLRLAYQQFGGPVYLWGESLGCGVVSGVLSKTDLPVEGVVMFLPWDSLANLAQTHYWFFPARWLVDDQFDNVENLKKYKGRVAVILAGDDEVIPVRHGLRLFESLEVDKKLWIFAGARHNEIPVEAGLSWWKEVIEFISPSP